MTRRRRALAAAAFLAILVVGGGAVVASSAKQQRAATAPAPVSTAKVSRGELVATVSQDGTLTYRARSDGSPYVVINQASGSYTKLPRAGQVIAPGHVLYRVDNGPVVLLRGSTPAYRTLSAGMTGPDVGELNADLIALGYATSAQLSRSSATFGSATTMAVEKLQAALGLTQNGTLTLGQAVFEPTALRVSAVSALLGGGAQPGQPVMQATSTARQVQVALDASQETDMAVGDRVRITLPSSRITPGVVSSVGAVATCPSSSGAGGPSTSSSSPAPGTDTCSSGGATPTITVDVAPSDPAATGSWDQAPVQVAVTTARVRDALTVPVTALLAQSSGAYSVEVVGARGRNYLVPVSLGLFDDGDGLVQVTGSGLVAGEQVVVAGT